MTSYQAVTREQALADWDRCQHDWVSTAAPQPRPWNGDTIQHQWCPRCNKERIIVVE